MPCLNAFFGIGVICVICGWFFTITNSGFQGDGDKVVKDALDSKGGFTWVLAGLKALMEHNLELNAIADAFPKGLKRKVSSS